MRPVMPTPRRLRTRATVTAPTVATEVGDVELRVPRDRNGIVHPDAGPQGQRRLDGLDAMIVSLYAGGMTIRDIQHHLVSTLGTELSHETISKITEEVADEVIMAAPRTRRPLPGDLPRRDHGQGPRWRARAQQGRPHRRRG